MTGLDAFYYLLGELEIVPLKNGVILKLSAGIHLYLKGRIKFQEIGKYVKQEKPTPMEEILMSVLYTDEENTFRTLAEDAQIHHIEVPTIKAICDLYFRKQLVFAQL